MFGKPLTGSGYYPLDVEAEPASRGMELAEHAVRGGGAAIRRWHRPRRTRTRRRRRRRRLPGGVAWSQWSRAASHSKSLRAEFE